MNQVPLNALSAFNGLGGSGLTRVPARGVTASAGGAAGRGAGVAQAREPSAGSATMRATDAGSRREVGGTRDRGDFGKILNKRTERSTDSSRDLRTERVGRSDRAAKSGQSDTPSADRASTKAATSKGPPEMGVESQLPAGASASDEGLPVAPVPRVTEGKHHPAEATDDRNDGVLVADLSPAALDDEVLDMTQSLAGALAGPLWAKVGPVELTGMPTEPEVDLAAVSAKGMVLPAVQGPAEPSRGSAATSGTDAGAADAKPQAIALATGSMADGKAGDDSRSGGEAQRQLLAAFGQPAEEAEAPAAVRPGRWEALSQAKPLVEARADGAEADATASQPGASRPAGQGIPAGTAWAAAATTGTAAEAAGRAAIPAADTAATPMQAKAEAAPAGTVPVGSPSTPTNSAQPPAVSPLSYAPATPPEVRFYTANAASILQSVRTQLLPNGGAMTLRLAPPEMGALQVAVVLKDGLASVTFRAENPEAVRMLSQTMAQLRDTLSAAGLTVDRLQVQQGSRSEGFSSQGSSSDRGSGNGQGGGGGAGGTGGAGAFQMEDEQARREQQRRELLERLWLKAAGVDSGVIA